MTNTQFLVLWSNQHKCLCREHFRKKWDQYNMDSKARASTFYEHDFEDEASLRCLILCIIGFSVLEIIGFDPNEVKLQNMVCES